MRTIVLETKNFFKSAPSGEIAMSKKSAKNTTRRGFVKEVAAGTAAIAYAGAFALDAAPVSQAGKESGSVESSIDAL